MRALGTSMLTDLNWGLFYLGDNCSLHIESANYIATRKREKDTCNLNYFTYLIHEALFQS